MQKESVRIHAKFVADQVGLAKVYYLCRALDTHNQGWVHVHVEFLQAFFGWKKRRTAKRSLLKLEASGALRGLRDLGNGLYDVQMRSWTFIEETLAGGWSFAATQISPAVLANQTELLKTAYSAAVFSQQERTERKINRTTKDSNRKVFRPDRMLTKAGQRRASKTVNGFPNVGRGKNFFLKNPAQQSYGASLKAVQHHLQKAPATVHKYTQHLRRWHIWAPTSDPQLTHYWFAKQPKPASSGGPTAWEPQGFRQRPSYFEQTFEVKNLKGNPQKRTPPPKTRSQADQDIAFLQSVTKGRAFEDRLRDLGHKDLKKWARLLILFVKKADATTFLEEIGYTELFASSVKLWKDLGADRQTRRLMSWLLKMVKNKKHVRESLMDCWQNIPAINY